MSSSDADRAAPISTPLFADHSRLWRDNKLVYPVISRRSQGLSIGVNLNPDQGCNFDCVYCSVDRTKPPVTRTVDLEVVRRELHGLLTAAMSGALWQDEPFNRTPASLRRLNDVAFSGDGEPTSYREFGDACRLASELIQWHQAPAKIVIITNATLLHRPETQAALAFLDTVPSEIWAKLDAGTAEHYHLIERTKVPFERVLDNLLQTALIRPITIQTMFLRYRGQPPSQIEITAYIERLRAIQQQGGQIRQVQVYTVARPTAESDATPLTVAEVDAIVAQVRTLGLTASGYYGPL